MDNNGDLLKKVVWTAFVLDKYNYYKHILKQNIETYSDLINEEEFEKFSKYQKENQLSCKMHIPVVLGYTTETKIVDIETNRATFATYKRCLCCGKYLNYSINLPYEIDAREYKFELNDNQESLDAKFYDILERFSHYATSYDKLDEIIPKFKKLIERKKTISENFTEDQVKSYKRVLKSENATRKIN